VSASDNPRWPEAINGPDTDGYLEAIKVEITTLTKLKACEVVPLSFNVNAIDSMCNFKFKRYPDGNIRELKAKFRRDRSIARR